MKKLLPTFSELLYGNLRPWHLHNNEMELNEMLASLQESNFKIYPRYELTFDRAVTTKRKFFIKVIDNQVVDCINKIHETVESITGNSARTYFISIFLQKELLVLLKDTNEIIERRGLLEEKFKPFQGRVLKGKTADEAFIFQYLKHQLVRLYLEVSDRYPEYCGNETMQIEDLYENCFNELVPINRIIIEVITPVEIAELGLTNPLQPEKQFKAVKGDVKPKREGVHSYLDVVKDQHFFAQFEEALFDYGFIDSDYNYINKQQTKNLKKRTKIEFANMYHFVISRGYLQQKLFNPNKAIMGFHIRKFLDLRYNVSLVEQFKKQGKKQEDLAKFYENHWLKSFPLKK